jgi:hypothetical protein
MAQPVAIDSQPPVAAFMMAGFLLVCHGRRGWRSPSRLYPGLSFNASRSAVAQGAAGPRRSEQASALFRLRMGDSGHGLVAGRITRI